jgi:predicted DNA-binding transcriptional regulator AlpA
VINETLEALRREEEKKRKTAATIRAAEEATKPAPVAHRTKASLGARAPLAPKRGRKFLRFKHLQEMGLISDYATLYDLIERHGFPAGYKLSHKIRVFDLDEVLAWIETRKAA